ncbi:MAG: sulfite oxidase-like oxidoreductase [Firmicutes bacterium]|nr:sulfite oxidase-like oxidoreductase [Alicyclobacillaceae bacterium]MCL6496544.1 sulfite oxidase-like oxidoreductase [Bacillota bacterium]
MPEPRVPPNQTVTRLFPVLHFGPVPRVALDRWRFRVFGLVRRPLEFSWEEMLQLRPKTVRADIHCVTGWSKLDTEWEGIDPQAVLEVAEPLPEARYVMVHGMNQFTANLELDDILAPDTVLAHRFAGAPLAAEHGGPMRLVVPHRYFWKSAKWVTGFELMAEDRPGFWEERGYHLRGDPWQEERYW